MHHSQHDERSTTLTSSISINNLTRRLDHSVPDGDFAPEGTAI
ncbi:hypothetical protein ACIP46_16610 [Streptomyces lavendulae]